MKAGDARGDGTCVVTGRGMPDELLPVVDLVSEIRKVKHPFDSGVQGRKGMEY